MRLKYKNQLCDTWSYYNEIKYMYEEIIKEQDCESQFYKQMKEKEYIETMTIFPTINLLHNLTWPFVVVQSELPSKVEMLLAIDNSKDVLTRKVDGMANLFKIKRITKEDSSERVQQIKSVKKHIANYKKQIEALDWYKDLITNTNIIEEKYQQQKEEQIKRNARRGL